ncbi:MAG: NADH-quinone oxidoreductase subunit L, partial [Candidatus Bathyarchaeota archaeon]
MLNETLVALTVILPFLSGTACLTLGSRKVRGWIVSLTAITLGASSILLLYGKDFSFTPMNLFGVVVLALDLSLLGYF